MTPSYWKRVGDLFAAARLVKREAQRAYLEEQCGSDKKLIEEVFSLLNTESKPGPLDETVDLLTPVGTTILAERFRIITHLGRGGMGDVFEAEDLRLRERVALKTIRPEIASDVLIVERFKREILLGKRVTHPNICRIHDLGVHRSKFGSEVLFLTMQFLKGETLASRLSRGRLSEKEAFPIIEDMADALAAAHNAGVIHRDFKSANVILLNGTDRTRAVVTDFGLAQAVRSNEVPITKSAGLIGTPAYMAPEQVKGEHVGVPTDIYSLGIVMYEMVTGRCPFVADSYVSVALKQINDQPQPPRKFAPGLDPNWEKVILRCLKKSSEERFQSADALKAALRNGHSEGGHMLFRKGKTQLLAAVFVILTILASALLWTNRQWWATRFSLTTLLPSHKRVVVLEFENVGGDAENRAFCEGLMQTFTNKLTDLEQFQGSFSVVPSSDVRKDKVMSVREAHREYNANLVITGSVQRSSNGLHLIVNVVDADKLTQLRSREIFVPSTDTVAMQEGVIKQVADLLDIELRPEAQRYLATGNTTVPGAYDFYLQGAGYLLAGHSTEQAITEFNHALELDPDYALAHAGLGEAYWNNYLTTKDQQWIQRAWKECERALKSNPNIAAAHITLAVLNAGTGKYQEAIRQSEAAIKIDPGNYLAYSQLAGALDALGRTEKAEATLKKAIELKPSYWKNYVRLGTFYFSHGRYREAENAYQRVTKLVPDNPTGYTNLGAIYHLEGQDVLAERMLTKSIQVRPTIQACANLATIYFFEGRYADAIPIMETLAGSQNVNQRKITLNMEPLTGLGSKDFIVWGNLGDAYRWTQGEQSKAVDAYRKAIFLAEQALKINPHDAGVLISLALYHVKIGDRIKALALVDRAVAESPKNSNVLFNSAVVYTIASKEKSALKYLNSAIRNGYSINEVASEPELDPLRNDPGYSMMIRSISSQH